MSKRILILSGSPRKGGNSDTLCDRFMEGAQDSGHAVEKIALRDLSIAACRACDYCKQHHGECVQKDDMAGVLQAMMAADVIVMATPVYFYTMNAQMKGLIDRCVATYTQLIDKEFYIILSAADTDISHMERTVEGFRGFFSCLPGARERGIIYGIGAWNRGDILRSPSMQEAYEAGKGV